MTEHSGGVRYVQRVPGPGGAEYLYLRRKGYPRVALTQPWGSEGLACEVEALCRALAPDACDPGTLREALRDYELRDADFLANAESTKALYRPMLKELDEDFGALAVAAFTPAYILRLKNTWAQRGHRAANLRLQVLKNALKPAMIAGKVDSRAFELVGQVRRPDHLKEPHVRWPRAVVMTVFEQAIAAHRYGLARAVALGRYSGARREDLCQMHASARAGGRLRFLSGKRKVPVDIREDPRLTALLARTPDQQPDEARRGRKVAKGARPAATLNLVFNLAGLPYTPDGLGQELAKMVERLHAEGRIDRDDYDIHGLRHTRGVELALAGATDAQGAAQLGHLGPSSFAKYRRQADRIRLADAADDLLREVQEQGPNGEVKNRVEKGCKNPAATAP